MFANNPEIELSRYLANDERVLWSGKPPEGVRLERSDLFLIPFSVLWGGFAIFWVAGVLISGGGVFALFGIPFVTIGIYMMVGRFVVDSKVRSRTAYAVTDRRILILSGFRSREFTTLSLAGLPGLVVDESHDGSGNISFHSGQPTLYRSSPMNFRFPGNQTQGPAFRMIPHVRDVAALIQEAQVNAMRATYAGEPSEWATTRA